ncbi:MAG: hypothetical protein ACRBB6_01820 [Neptuniibacter sp.]
MKKDFLDNPKNVKRIVHALVACCVILFGLDFILHRHTQHPWEEMFGFYAIYGFVSCVILVLLAKELRKLIMRSEDYYQNHQHPQSPQQKQEENND